MNPLLSEGCSAWKVFIDWTPESNLLLVGGSLKDLAHNLAPDAGKLFALDCDTRSLQFAQPATAAGASVCAVAGGDGAGLPFADNSMDVVVLNQSPRFLRLQVLHELRRILKADGQLFIGGDNRFSYELFSGDGEDGQAPGFLSRLYSLCMRKQPHEYSLGGYKRLLVAAGFPQSDFLGLLNDGRFVEEIVPVDGDFPAWLAPHGQGWRQRLKRSRYFVPAYGIIASALAQPRISIHARIAEAVAEALVDKDREAVSLQFHKYEITGKQKLIVHARSGDQRLLIKHTFDSKGTESERNNRAVLQHLAAQRPRLHTVPRSIASGVIGQQVYFAETAVEGRPLKHLARGAQRARIVKSAMDFLLEVNPPELCEHVLLDEALFDQYVSTRLARITPLLKESTQVKQLQAFFRKHLLGKNMMLGIAHGDFSSNNILIEGTRVSGVFDWEAGSVLDIPARDAISALVSVHRASGAKLSLAQCLALLANRQWPDAVEFNALLDLYAAMGIDEECHTGIVYLSWLNGMDLRLRYGMNNDPVAISRFIHDVVSAAALG